MVGFVNAKLNLGLQILRKREDSYHDLATIFYPVGIHNGTPYCPEPFCDILEISPSEGEKEDSFTFLGNRIDCEPDRNLVVRACRMFRDELTERDAFTLPITQLTLGKYLPDGAGLGGGSADASFVLKMLNEMAGEPFDEKELIRMAARLGADCPFFILNKPAYATGIGENLMSIESVLDGYWAVIVKPDVYISTKEAFSGIKPKEAEVDLRDILKLPVEEWDNAGMKNDFEPSIFRNHTQLKEIKEKLYALGAKYAAMSGSGSSLFGIYAGREEAMKATAGFKGYDRNLRVFLCKL